MKALISPLEKVFARKGEYLGFRVCQISEDIFPVVDPLFWVECDGSITTQHAYSSGQFVIEEENPVDTPVPTEVSRFQARAALYVEGYFDRVEHYMTHPDTDFLIKLAWQDAQVFRRDSPTVAALGKYLGLDDSKLDNLFVLADSIKA